MRRSFWGRLAKLLATVAVACGAAVFAVGQVRDAEVARGDQLEVARLTEKMTTVCIGRFLIDLPEEARLELAQPRIDGFDISSFDEPEADFRIRLGQREARLRAAPDQSSGNKNLESVREIRTDNGVVGKIFVHGRTVTEGTQANGLKLERYRYEGVAIEALVHGKGMSFDISADPYDPDQIENLPKLIAKLVPNPDNRAPTEPGFCVHRAWLKDPLTADQGEQIMMFAQLPRHPDIELIAMLAAGLMPDKQSLLERDADAQAGLTSDEKKRVSNLRAAPRTIGGITGDEVVTRVAELKDTIGYSFWWEVDGTESNVLVPHFVLKITTGQSNEGPVPSSLSQAAAMALWDKISSSIRFHTPAPAKIRPAVSPSSGSASALRRPEA